MRNRSLIFWMAYEIWEKSGLKLDIPFVLNVFHAFYFS